MDIPRPDGFNECYIYEGTLYPLSPHIAQLNSTRTHGMRSRRDHPLRAAANRRPLPILHLPDPLWPQIHPLSQCPAPRFKARQPPRECRLRTQNLRLWSRPRLQYRS